MFNFTSDALYVPGVSDLLLFEVIKQSKTEGRKYMNLDLGINPGVTFFKGMGERDLSSLCLLPLSSLKKGESGGLLQKL